MGIQIQTGGMGGQFGGGLGAGFASGVEDELKFQREQEVAAEKQARLDEAAAQQVQAVQAQYGANLNRVDALVPDERLGSNLKGEGQQVTLPGGVPVWLKPEENPDQVELDGLKAVHEQAFESFTDPAAAQTYAIAASQEVNAFNSALVSKRLGKSMEAAIASGAASEQEVAQFAMALEGGADPLDVTAKWQDFTAGKVTERKGITRVGRLTNTIGQASAFFANQATDPQNADEASFLVDKASQLEELQIEINSALEFGYEGVDVEAAWDEYKKIKHSLDPEQERIRNKEIEEDKHGRAMQLEKLQGLTAALGKAAEERNMPALEALQDQIDLLLGGEVAIPAGIANPDRAGGLISPATPDLFTPPGQEGSGASAPAPGPETEEGFRVAEYNRLANQAVAGDDPFGETETLVDLDTALMDRLGKIIFAADGEYQIDWEGDGLEPHMAKVTEALAALRKKNPKQADALEGQFLSMIEAYEERAKWISGKPDREKAAEKTSLDTEIGSAAWGGA
jgi:hypothetical protein